MSQFTTRANLSAKSFPFLSDNWGRSVIIKQYDQSFNRQLQSPEDQDKDIGIPQIFYCHNVMPFSEGFQSIGYNTVLNANVTPVTFNKTYLLRDNGINKGYLAQDFATKLYYINDSSGWLPILFFSVHIITSVAYINGKTYFWIDQVGLHVYDSATFTLIFVPTVLNILTTLGICASSGYLIAWNILQIAWSSTIDPTDFTPSLITGAGGGSVEEAAGALTIVVPHTQGLIVYSTSNAVVGLATRNARYPFAFKEINGSGGCSSIDLVAADANSGDHYAYTTQGLQLVSTSSAKIIFPELTDFISGKVFEDYNESDDTFNLTILSSTMQKKLALVANRYLIISYGTVSLTHALIYDIGLKRFGKIKLTHTFCIEYTLPSPIVTEIPKQSIGFLLSTGVLRVVDFSRNPLLPVNGIIALGKYQFVRSNLLTLDTFTVEDILNQSTFVPVLFSSIDGKNTTKSYPALIEAVGEYAQFGVGIEAINHSLVLKGIFQTNSLILKFHLGGSR